MVETMVEGVVAGAIEMVLCMVVGATVDRSRDCVGLGVRDGVTVTGGRAVVGRAVAVRVAETSVVTVGFNVFEVVGRTTGSSVPFAVGIVVRDVKSPVGFTVVVLAVTVGDGVVAFETEVVVSSTGVAAVCVDAFRDGEGADAWTAQRHTPIKTRSRRTVLMRGLKANLRNGKRNRGTGTVNAPLFS
ncbi:MAG: hypothetical protein AB7S61_09840 [Methanoregulaceae archaeon]